VSNISRLTGPFKSGITLAFKCTSTDSNGSAGSSAKLIKCSGVRCRFALRFSAAGLVNGLYLVCSLETALYYYNYSNFAVKLKRRRAIITICSRKHTARIFT
jgi:hypothetical protein